MERVGRIGLISSLFLAVLAFGGTEPLYFSAVQVLLFGLGLLFLLGYGSLPRHQGGLPLAVPLILVALVLLQLLPFSSLGEGAAQLGADRPVLSSIAPYVTLSHFLLLLTYLCAFYLTLVVAPSRRGKRQLVYGLLTLGTIVAVYGLVQHLTGWRSLFPAGDMFAPQGATGPYVNRNHFAGFLEMIIPFCLALVLTGFARLRHAHLRQSREWSEEDAFPKLVFWLFLAVLLFTALVFSRSRMGLISSLVSVLIVIVLFATLTRRRRAATVAAALVFLLAGVLMAVWIGPDPVLARFELLETGGIRVAGRWGIWQDTLRLIQQHPWLGTGLGTFPVAYPAVQTAHLNRFVNHAHNDYLEVASEIGVFGAAILFGAILYTFVAVIRGVGRNHNPISQATGIGAAGALAAILCHSLTDFNLYIPANALVFSVVLGLGYLTSQSEIEGNPPVSPRG